MHEAKLHRAKCLRVRGFENLFRLAARRRGILSWQCGFGASMFEHFRRQEASERAFSSISRRQEASERAFSSIFDVRRLRSEHFRAFSTSGGFGASIFEHFGRQEAPQRGFSRFLEASRLSGVQSSKAAKHFCTTQPRGSKPLYAKPP